MKLIGSIAAAAGWRAVFLNTRTKKLETLPVAYWNQRAVENDHGAVETVGVVLIEDTIGFTEATDEATLKDRKLIGYAAPAEPLTRWEKKIAEEQSGS